MHFIKKIRQKLAAENNVAKYLRYAIGEILLLVIGILELTGKTMEKQDENFQTGANLFHR